MQHANLDIRNRLATASLPAMPQILVQLMERCQADEIGMAQLAELIAKDAAMTTKILRVANSSAYHRRTRPASLEQSLMLLGIDMVKTLVISESVFQVFGDLSQANRPDLRVFWKHSLLAAVTARLIAQKIDYPHVEEAYLAGLLHDVGRLALLSLAPREYTVNFSAPDDENLCAVEQRTLELTHAEAGAWMIGNWNLDSFLADSVLYHHEPMTRLEKSHPLIRIVSLAEFLAHHAQEDPSIEKAGALCGLAAGDLTAINLSAAKQVQEAADHLGIDLTDADTVPPPVPLTPPAPKQHGASEKLNEAVRNIVLTSQAGASFSKPQDETGLLETVTRSARILFGFKDATVFLVDAPGRALKGISMGEQRQRLAGFSIPLDGGGAIAEAALRGRTTFLTQAGAGNALGVVEEQLRRILGAEDLVCLPLGIKARCVGVLIGSMEPCQLADFRRREGLLQAFAVQAGSALIAMLSDNGKIRSQDIALAEQYREASRWVAHEANNPLAIIKNYLSVLDRKLAKQEPVSGEISILNEEIDRVGQLINGLADLQLDAQQGATEVGRIVAGVVRLFLDTESVPASVQIVVRQPEQAFEVASDGNTLKQILMNLIKNAAEAMPNGGKIEVGISGFVNRDGHMHVELWIKDSGPGIPAEVMAKLFSPVQSTKGDGHRGLGLSIVHGLVKNMHGHISCRSHKNGTTFEILLPVPSASNKTPAWRPPVRNSA
jgi:HD-like signal output (HDOD) protein/signal transduction histidine kinase